MTNNTKQKYLKNQFCKISTNDAETKSILSTKSNEKKRIQLNSFPILFFFFENVQIQEYENASARRYPFTKDNILGVLLQRQEA